MLPNRGADNCVRFLLSSGSNLGWSGSSRHGGACHQPAVGFAVPMLIGTVSAALIFVVLLLSGPETEGKSVGGRRSQLIVRLRREFYRQGCPSGSALSVALPSSWR